MAVSGCTGQPQAGGWGGEYVISLRASFHGVTSHQENKACVIGHVVFPPSLDLLCPGNSDMAAGYRKGHSTLALCKTLL
eukprot:364743-Chlamydomonas_euryale.AAC.78